MPFCCSAEQSIKSLPNSEWLRTLIQFRPERNRTCASLPASIASAVERISRAPLTATRFASMKSMNSATPACFAPRVSSPGMIMSARCSTRRYCWADKNSGSYADGGEEFAGVGAEPCEQANAHLEKPGKEAATVAMPMYRRISRRSTPCPPKVGLSMLQQKDYVLRAGFSIHGNGMSSLIGAVLIPGFGPSRITKEVRL